MGMRLGPCNRKREQKSKAAREKIKEANVDISQCFFSYFRGRGIAFAFLFVFSSTRERDGGAQSPYLSFPPAFLDPCFFSLPDSRYYVT